MKKEVMEKWVAALRSGKWEQGFGRLKTQDNKYCCLGVLCQVLDIPINLDTRWGSDSILSMEAQELGGLQSPNGIMGLSYSLAELNDTKHTFLEIADIIEDNWEKL